nr:TPA: orf y [Tanacetum cinerariifolium]
MAHGEYDNGRVAGRKPVNNNNNKSLLGVAERMIRKALDNLAWELRSLEKQQLASSGQAQETEIAEQHSKSKEDLEYIKATTEYQEAIQATEDIEPPAVGFAKTTDYKEGLTNQVNAVIKQNNTLLYLSFKQSQKLIELEEKFDKLKQKVNTIIEKEIQPADLEDSISSLAKRLNNFSISGLQHIHLGIFMIRLHALHQRSAGTNALVVLRDTKWEDCRQIIAIIEVDLSARTQLVYTFPDMILSVNDFHNHVEVVIQTHGYDTWQGGESNLLITMALTGRLSNTSYMGFQYSVENVVDHLTTNGITAIPDESRSIEELEGMSWNLKPPKQTSVHVPSRVAVNERLNRSVSLRFERYRQTPQPPRYSVDRHDREVIGNDNLDEDEEHFVGICLQTPQIEHTPYDQDFLDEYLPQWDDQLATRKQRSELEWENPFVAKCDPGLWSDAISRWESIIINRLNHQTWSDNKAKLAFVENLLGESEKLMWQQWRTAYPGAYSALETITDDPQNITSQVRQLIIMEDPYRGLTDEQDMAYKDLDRITCEETKNLWSFLEDFRLLAIKSRKLYFPSTTEKLFAKLPPSLSKKIEESFKARHPDAALAKELRDLSFCSAIPILGYYKNNRKKYGIRKSRTHKGKPHNSHVKPFKRKYKDDIGRVKKCKCFIYGKEGHFAKDCRSKQGNIARSVVYQELDLDDNWDIVSADFDDSSVYSISKGEGDVYQNISIMVQDTPIEEAAFMAIEERSWKPDKELPTQSKSCEHDWKENAVTNYTICYYCRILTTDMSRLNCPKCQLTSCGFCAKNYLGKTVNVKRKQQHKPEEEKDFSSNELKAEQMRLEEEKDEEIRRLKAQLQEKKDKEIQNLILQGRIPQLGNSQIARPFMEAEAHYSGSTTTALKIWKITNQLYNVKVKFEIPSCPMFGTTAIIDTWASACCINKKVIPEEALEPLTQTVFFNGLNSRQQATHRIKQCYFLIEGNKFKIPLIYAFDMRDINGINTIIKRIGGAKIFSKFDLKSGFHQVAMDEELIPWTVFLVPGGLFEWLVMPFGLKNAPAEHAKHLEKMLKICEDNGLVLSPTKMKTEVSTIDFLGVVIGEGTIKLQPHIIKKIINFNEEELKTKKGLRSFLRILNYAQNHIPKLGILLRPLYEKSNAHGDKRMKSSDYELVRKIKEQVQNLLDLEIPPENAYIILETDGCMEGWGGIVKWKKSKEDPRGSKRICAYTSGKFSTTQSIIDVEINACINTIEKVKIYYLDKQEVALRTDCQAIISFYNKTNSNKSSRVRWINFADAVIGTGVKINIEHIERKHNTLVDSLSRLVNLCFAECTGEMKELAAAALQSVEEVLQSPNAFQKNMKITCRKVMKNQEHYADATSSKPTKPQSKWINLMHGDQSLKTLNCQQQKKQLKPCRTYKQSYNAKPKYALDDQSKTTTVFPQDRKYVSLFKKGDTTETVDKRNSLRIEIKENIAVAIASGKDFEGSDDDGLDLSEDDFFLRGSSSDEADADDELTDKSARDQASDTSENESAASLVCQAMKEISQRVNLEIQLRTRKLEVKILKDKVLQKWAKAKEAR